MQILTVFPGFVLQQIQNALAIRQVLPKGLNADRAELDLLSALPTTRRRCRRARLRQNNLAGPAGYVSMEDGASAASCSAASPPPATSAR